MHDIKYIRENPAAFDAQLAKRGLPPASAKLLELDAKRRERQTALQTAQAKRNDLSKQVGQLKRENKDASAVMAEVARLKSEMDQAEAEDREIATQLDDMLAVIPNLPTEGVPVGPDETHNKEIRKVGTPRAFNFAPKQHFDIGEALGLMDFERAAKISGARFVVLKGALARLERAIASFMLELHTGTFGYLEVNPPLLVSSQTAYGTGNLPKFAEDLFRTTNNYWLIPTAEVSLTNLVADEIVDEAKLPMRMTAWTPCFRSEAGAAGKDTRGMIRQHQFSKVELVSIAHPDKSQDEHERMVSCAEEVLKRLGLPYRTIVLCTGDMGFAAQKTYDIEVWLPGQNTYREISSCSNCGEFQARRMKARFRRAGEKGTRFVHTLNGSGLAVGRTLIAVLENYQQADGSVVVPEALRPFMGGLEVIQKIGD